MPEAEAEFSIQKKAATSNFTSRRFKFIKQEV